MSDAGLTLQLINALPDGAIVIDGSATVLAANSLAEDALNLRLAGLNVSAVIRNASFIDALATVLADGAAQSVDIEVRGKPPRQLSAHISPMKGNGWVPVSYTHLTLPTILLV